MNRILELAGITQTLTEDLRISNIRKGDAIFDKLVSLSKSEIDDVRGKAINKTVGKRYKGASFIVVGTKGSDIVYFRIDKADLKEELADVLAEEVLTEGKLPSKKAVLHRIEGEVMAGLSKGLKLTPRDKIVIKAGITDAFDDGYDLGEEESER